MSGQAVTTVAGAALAAIAVLVWPSKVRGASRRLAALSHRPELPAAVVSADGRVRVLGAVGSAAAVAFLVGLPWGVLVGGVAGLVAYLVLGRLEPLSSRRRREQLARDLPVAADLLAACLRSGSSPVTAAAAVSTAIGGPLADALRGVVGMLRLGNDPVECWSALGRDPILDPLGRAVSRAVASGASVSTALEQVAADAREQRRITAEESARRVGVRAAAPLGLCFLPAFVLLAVVPVVAGIAAQVRLW